jgi:hypothetical protein
MNGRGRTIARCPECGGWAMASCCGLCGPFPVPTAPLGGPVDDLQARAHRGALEAALDDNSVKYRPTQTGLPAHWGRGAPDRTA